MPATDICEPSVIRALEKEGWQIIEQQVSLELDDGEYVFADLRIQRGTRPSIQQLLIVEIKCFYDINRRMSDLYTAIGQYIVYRAALEYAHSPQPVYLAVPAHAYNNVFQLPVIQKVIKNLEFKMLIVDLAVEEIIEWIR
jgi:XisH protein